jgi:ribosomal protein L37AE/L43A
MSKARSKGPTIGVQLSLNADAEVRRRAAERGVSPGLYLAAALERSFGPDGTKPAVTPLAERRAARRDESNVSTTHHPSSIACIHKGRVSIGGGLWKCNDCGRTKGTDGSWR